MSFRLLVCEIVCNNFEISFAVLMHTSCLTTPERGTSYKTTSRLSRNNSRVLLGLIPSSFVVGSAGSIAALLSADCEIRLFDFFGLTRCKVKSKST